MEKNVNSRIVEDIDETFLLNSIAEPGIIAAAFLETMKRKHGNAFTLISVFTR